MLVNPELLRALATQVESVAAGIRGIDLTQTASAAADGLPGSSTQWATRQVGQHVALAANGIIQDVQAMGQAVRGAGDRYEVEDDALASKFKGLF